ncbi:hypothetical protein GCM10028773_42930 [Spirosoma koreense]
MIRSNVNSANSIPAHLNFVGRTLVTTNNTIVRGGVADDHQLNGLRTLINNKDMSFVLTTLKQNLQGDITNESEVPYAIVLYHTGSANNILLDQIKGVSFLFQNGLEHYHKIYSITQQTTFEDKRFSAYYPEGFSSKSIDLIGRIIFDSKISYTFIGNITPKTYFSSNLLFANKIKPQLAPSLDVQVMNYSLDLLRSPSGTLETQSTCDPGTCGMNASDAHCALIDNDPTDPSKGSSWVCLSDCSIGSANSQIKVANARKSAASTIESLEIKPAYNFRDNFLLKRQMGRYYVDAYYRVGRIALGMGMMRMENLNKHLQLFKLAYQAASILQNGKDKEVVVSKEFRDQAISMINDYKKVAPNNKDYQSVLNQLSKDIIFYYEKPRNQVLSTFK